MNHIQFDGHPNWSHELRLLAMNADSLKSLSDVQGEWRAIYCEQRDSRKRTQNSGVMAHGGRNGVDYYGVLHSVVELVYGQGMTVHLFKCRWFDTRP